MKKYLVTYHMPMSFMEMAKDGDPQEMKAGMEAWMAWFTGCGDHLVDMGTQLGRRTAADRLRELAERAERSGLLDPRKQRT